MKKRISIIVGIILLLVLVVSFNSIAALVVNIEWFKEVGYLQVFFTKVISILKLLVPLFILFFIFIWIYYDLVRKNLKKISPVVDITNKKSKGKYRAIFFLINTIVSFVFAYLIASTYWYQIAQFTSGTNFNVKDPIFNLDVAFYVFKLPLILSIHNILMAVLVIFIVLTIVLYFIFNLKDSLDDPQAFVKGIKSGLSSFAGKQLAIFAALFLILLSIGSVLNAVNILYSPRGVVFGAGYTDVKISLIFDVILAVVLLISAIVVSISIIKRKPKPMIFCGIAVVVVLVLNPIVTSLVQNFLVKSNQISFEEPYIKNNIEYTRKAFNIDNLKEIPYSVENTLEKKDVEANKDVLNNIKINSYEQALDFYQKVQVIRHYYTFNDVDIDRYNIDGKYSQVFVSPREIDLEKIEPNTWQNKHLVYTHGYGLVMSKVNEVTSEGQPKFIMKDLPTDNTSGLKLDNPRIYFGEKTNYYAVVNTKTSEFDYPQAGENKTNNYDGKAGIKMTGLNKLLFASYFGDINFLTSKDITSESKILLNRNIIDRVNKIAPFLKYDSDPYIVVSGGKLYWVIDAYTTTNKYPYSQPYNDVNYIRNSAKVIIDAADGTTDFYITDKNDPIINSYAKIFKGLFKDIEKVPQDLKDHFRYPEELFNLQTQVLGKYHMTDPRVFLTAEDLWETATQSKDVSGKKTTNGDAYVMMKLPNSDKVEMVLLDYFNVRGRENMSAMYGVRMDGDNYGQMVLYKFPPNKTVYSPQLFAAKIQQDPSISKELSLWDTKGSKAEFGDTVIVPIHSSLLYIKPLYLKADGANSIPEMKRVIVNFGEKIVSAESIDKALAEIFNISTQTPVTPPTTGGSTGTASGEYTDFAKRVKSLLEEATNAQKSGDWAKYGEKLKELTDLINSVVKQ